MERVFFCASKCIDLLYGIGFESETSIFWLFQMEYIKNKNCLGEIKKRFPCGQVLILASGHTSENVSTYAIICSNVLTTIYFQIEL